MDPLEMVNFGLHHFPAVFWLIEISPFTCPTVVPVRSGHSPGGQSDFTALCQAAVWRNNTKDTRHYRKIYQGLEGYVRISIFLSLWGIAGLRTLSQSSRAGRTWTTATESHP